MSQRRVTIADRDFDVVVEGSGGRAVARVGELEVELLELREHEAVVLVDGQRRLVSWSGRGEDVEIVTPSDRYEALVTDAGARRKKRASDHSAAAPMPGVVLKILVSPGDRVAAGEPLLVLEAMKMEHQIRAPHEGVIAALRCSVGDLVQPGVDLVELEEGPES